MAGARHSRRRDARPGRRTAATDRRAPNQTPRRAARILDALEAAHPEASCALHHADAYQLTMATILSAQCTDKRVNEVTPTLFARYPTPVSLAAADPAELESIIRPTGFFRAKARSLIGCARAIAGDHGGEVPRDLATLVRLPGIGRKTANVVLSHAYGIAEGIAVDTHVLRLANRLGLASCHDPEKVEAALMGLLPRERWTRTTDVLIFHGRKVCDARRPACGACPVFGLCAWESRQAHALVSPGTSPRQAKGRARVGP